MTGASRASTMPERLALGAILMLCVAASAARPATAAEPARGSVYAASDGKGEVRLLWFPVPDAWPPGWRLEDAATGAVLADRVYPADPGTLAKLAPEDQTAVREFGELLSDDTQGRNLGAFIFTLKAATNWDFALALGVGRVLPGVAAGPRSYRVVGLDRAGAPTGLQLVSAPVDSSVLTPLPPAPLDLRASVVSEGISISWTPSPPAGPLPIVAWRVFRDGGKETNSLITPQPLVVGRQREGEPPAYIDRDPPRNETLTYRVHGTDPFGRLGDPAQTAIFSVAPVDLTPPLLLAETKNDRAELSWDPGTKTGRAGFLVERAYLREGPYELLTPKMLKPDADRHRDEGLVPATYYFYRIRSVGPDGEVGEPSPAMRIRAGGGKLPRPKDLKAAPGRIGIRLTWEQPTERVEGFMVERWSPASRKWARLTARSIPRNAYDDFFPPQSSGTYRYRVRAVGYDYSEGEPSKEVEATLPDTLGPRPPEITGIDAEEGKVLLRFTRSTSADADRVCVVRSGEPDADGLVIGEPLPAKATEFRDTGVEAGRRYWYRLVAFDRSENRGDLSAPVSIVVPAVHAAAPKPPALRLRTSPITIVEVAFAAPPAGHSVVVERQAGAGPWLTIAGPARQSPLVDAGPPAGKVAYRLRLQAAGGEVGEPSEAAEVDVP